MYKKGFTLSEVMVVLGILGVIAAFLIPAITKTAPNNNRVMFRKGYYTLEQAISQIINDDTNYPSDKVDGSTPPIPRGFNYTTKTSNEISGTTVNKFCYFLADKLNTVGSTTCPPWYAGTDGYFITTDGVVWTIVYPGAVDDDPNNQFPMSPPAYALKIVMDVNGTSKGPNCSTDSDATSYFFGPGAAPTLARCSFYNTCSDIPDRFIIGVRYDGKLQIGSGATTDTCANNILSDPTRNTK